VALCVSAAVLSLAPFGAIAARHIRARHPASHLPVQRSVPYPNLPLPLEINGSQYIPLAWADIPGWNEDDHLAAYRAFRTSCKPIAAQNTPPSDPKALGVSLRDSCRVARAENISDAAKAKVFFEAHFVPLKISRLGEDDGFVTGYYEPVLEGSRTKTDVYNVPVYRRPSNLFVRGFTQDSVSLPNKGAVYRKIGRRKLVPYYDRAEIEDGAIAGRGLEICWLKDPTDLLFAQIQGSARIHLPDGSTIRINYDAHNGYPYTAVGRVLIDRGIIPKEEMSMQRIREWMEQSGRRAGRAVDAGPLDRGGQVAACLWHAILHHRRIADRIGAVEDAIPSIDDRAGHRLGDCRTRPRRSLFRRRRRCRQGIRAPAAHRALCHAGAQKPRPGRARPQATAAGRAAVGEDRKTVSAR
jgi:membrane-bound lytic murein transglycosylase A